MRSCEHFLVALGSDYSYCFWFRLCQHSYYFIFRLYVNILIASGSDYVNASWVPGYSGITVALYYILCNISTKLGNCFILLDLFTMLCIFAFVKSLEMATMCLSHPILS